MFRGRARSSRVRYVAVVALALAVGSAWQIVMRFGSCRDLMCQLHYATTYSSVTGVPLAFIIGAEAVGLGLSMTLLQLRPRSFGSVGRVSLLLVCSSGAILALRIAMIETLLLKGWSPLCVAASWLSFIVLAFGIFVGIDGHPRTRVEGGITILASLVIGVLCWHLMQEGGLPEVRAEKADPSVLLSARSNVMGPETAKLQIVEFADFRCPPCRRVAPELQLLIKKYPGSIRLVQRELPNERIHPQAERAAEIAQCFGEQGKYWNVASELYSSSTVPDDKALDPWIAKFNVDGTVLHECMAQHRTLPIIRKDQKDAHSLGVGATPTLFIGDKVLEGVTSIDKLDGLLKSQMSHAPGIVTPLFLKLPASGSCSVQQDEKQQVSVGNAPCT